jgi:hypothetical protein
MFFSFGSELTLLSLDPPTTFQPSSAKNLTMCEPMKPSAPVTNAVFFIDLLAALPV